MDKQNEKLAMRVSFVTIAGNIALSLFKFIAGFLSGSSAMISDAVHSASDVFSTLAVIIGVKVSGKAADKNHPYGHERFECVAAIILAGILFATGIGIGYAALGKILGGDYAHLAVPGSIALVAAVASIVSKEAMYQYTKRAAKKINSSALMADAWHHRSDALSSIGSFIGIAGARMGFPVLDPVAGLVICFFIAKASLDIFVDAINKMTDTACSSETAKEIEAIVLKQEGVMGIDLLKTRMFGDKIYVDIEIQVCADSLLSYAHGIAEAIHDEIENTVKGVKHCMVHVNPCLRHEEKEISQGA